VPTRELVRTPPRRLQLTREDGARPLIWLANSPDAAGSSGAYYDGFTKNATVNPQANDADLATRAYETYRTT
jgi:hypothetical protein